MNPRIPGLVAIAVFVFLGAAGFSAEQTAGADLEILQLRPNFYMIAGAGGNIGVQVGVDGVVVVDSGSAASREAVVAAIKKITAQPIRYLVNTSADPDHVGGNDAIAKAGQTLFTRGGGVGIGADFLGGGASILSVEQVLTRMSGTARTPSPFPVDAWPTETFSQSRKYMYLNGEGIEIFHQPAAHTDGDAIVFFRRSDVIVAGDVFDTTRFPVIDPAKGGSIQGEIAALQSATPESPIGPPCVTTVEATPRETAPHYLPEKNPFVDEMTTRRTSRCGPRNAGNDLPGISEED
jgi:glyoxylase-like metal-dependent hydrolase (beta-lactamase superfamily II)